MRKAALCRRSNPIVEDGLPLKSAAAHGTRIGTGQHLDRVGQPLQALQAHEQGECTIRWVVDKFGSADIADHQGVAGQNEPRLIRSRAVGDQEADMLGRVAGRVHHIDNDVAQRQAVAILHRMERESDLGTGVQDVFGTRLAGEGTAGGTMVGMDMGVDDEANAHAGVVGNP
jgi:hypothetical protein